MSRLRRVQMWFWSRRRNFFFFFKVNFLVPNKKDKKWGSPAFQDQNFLIWKLKEKWHFGAMKENTLLDAFIWWTYQWRPFNQIYSTGVARVPTVVSAAFYYRLDVCNLCKLLFQTQFLSNYPTIIMFYLFNNIPQVNNTCIISCTHLLTCY